MSMQLFYVPEIGDKIVLEEDWIFNLYPEKRNKALGAFFGYWENRLSWIKTEDLKDWSYPEPVVENLPSRNDPKYKTGTGNRYDHVQFTEDYNLAKTSDPAWKQWISDWEEWEQDVKKLSTPNIPVEVKLPKRSVLTIDRIYIRKGSAGYSSISFFCANLGNIEYQLRRYSAIPGQTKKVKSPRFWAKLKDCNTIQFKKFKDGTSN